MIESHVKIRCQIFMVLARERYFTVQHLQPTSLLIQQADMSCAQIILIEERGKRGHCS